MPLTPSFDIDEEMVETEDEICHLPLFSTKDIEDAAKVSNFNKGLGPDCFDGNILKDNEKLREKLNFEITSAMNSKTIPNYLRCGRLVPL
jgi:hypothetical protein